MSNQDTLPSIMIFLNIFQNCILSYEIYKTGKISSNITNTNLYGLWLPKAETLRQLLTNKTILMPIAHFALLCFDILFQMKLSVHYYDFGINMNWVLDRSCWVRKISFDVLFHIL